VTVLLSGVQYRDVKLFRPDELQNLFLSVKWIAGKHPEKLAVAMENSSSVFSAWDNDRLIGLINALDDGSMTVYVHFLLVHPDYQGKGIGKELLKMMNDKYRDYLRVVLIADENETGFYQNSGFELADGTKAMFINRF